MNCDDIDVTTIGIIMIHMRNGVISDCMNPGDRYVGNRRLTLSGRTCQRWDSQSPHKHNTNPIDLPEASLSEASNFCRNPDNKPTGPWCYTTDLDVIWETCSIHMCNGRTFNKDIAIYYLYIIHI